MGSSPITLTRWGFVGQGEAGLPGPEVGHLSRDLEPGPPLQDEEDLVAEVVAVQVRLLSRLHAQKPRAHLRGDEDVAHVAAVVEDFHQSGSGAIPSATVSSRSLQSSRSAAIA